MAETPGYDDTIIQAVITALDGIASDSGYNYSLVDVRELDRYESAEGLRPCARVKWINEGLVLGQTEWETVLRLRIEAKIDKGTFDGTPTSKKERLLKRDIVKALSAMDFTTLDILMRTIDVVSFSEEDSEEASDGVALIVGFEYVLDFNDPDSSIAPTA